ncbi:MAG: prolyl oligopeptidase family serine peptidase [Gemmatimonadetes bacterium]|nr:prolyl oligopeptidase family serine peptidase [Gemmatimonadota bacterium]
MGWDFTPDGKSIVFDGLMEETSDKNYRDSDINVVDIATGTMRKLTAQRGSWSAPAVSPDGKWIAFAGYASTRDSYKTAELFVMAADGSGMKKLSGNLDRDVGDLTWARDNSGVYFTASDRGTNQLFFASARGVVRPITAGQHMFSSAPSRRTGRWSGRAPPRRSRPMWSAPLTNPSQLTRLTSVNADILANKKLGAIEELWITSSGGTKVQGGSSSLQNFDLSKKWPAAHGDSRRAARMYNVGFSYMYQNFAANGYVVLYTNPRGSTGYGSAFGNAIMKKYPGVDYDDLMASVDTVVGRGYVDQSRMRRRLFGWWCAVQLDHRPHQPIRGCRGALSGDELDLLCRHRRRSLLHAGLGFEKPYWEDPKAVARAVAA